MKFKFLLTRHFYIAICAAFLLISCREVQSQQNPEEASLTQHCNHLNEKNGYDYKVISGKAVRIEKIFPAGDYISHDEYKKREAVFVAIMKPLAEVGGGDEKEFHVYTKPETVENLSSKPFYMEQDKNYHFCAREIESTSETPTQTWYQVDFIETIQEIK